MFTWWPNPCCLCRCPYSKHSDSVRCSALGVTSQCPPLGAPRLQGHECCRCPRRYRAFPLRCGGDQAADGAASLAGGPAAVGCGGAAAVTADSWPALQGPCLCQQRAPLAHLSDVQTLPPLSRHAAACPQVLQVPPWRSPAAPARLRKRALLVPARCRSSWPAGCSKQASSASAPKACCPHVCVAIFLVAAPIPHSLQTLKIRTA